MTGKRYYLTTFAAWRRHAGHCAESHFILLDSQCVPMALASAAHDSACEAAGDVQILALVVADEAAHIALESDVEVEPLPHLLARTPISKRAAAALAAFGVVPGDDTFTATEKLSRIHPLLKHRVF